VGGLQVNQIHSACRAAKAKCICVFSPSGASILTGAYFYFASPPFTHSQLFLWRASGHVHTSPAGTLDLTLRARPFLQIYLYFICVTTVRPPDGQSLSGNLFITPNDGRFIFLPHIMGCTLHSSAPRVQSLRQIAGWKLVLGAKCTFDHVGNKRAKMG
jgi:hypothetical protein